MKIINFAHAAFVTLEDMPLSSAQGSGCLWALVLPLAFATGAICGTVNGGNDRALALPAPLDAILCDWGLGIVIGRLLR